MKYRSLAILVLAFSVLSASLSCSPVERKNYHTQAMGTEMVITIESADSQFSAESAEKAYAEIQRLNVLLSTWNPNSPLSQVNINARDGWADMDEEIYALLKDSVTYAELTDGRYDITAGPLVRLWGFFAKKERKPPQQENIDAAMTNIGYEKVLFDDERGAILFQTPEMEIDLGGIAKGYAVDMALAVIKEHGIETALINLGGNISFTGLPKGKIAWAIAVRDPRSKTELLGVLTLGAEFESWGIASSGQYERFFMYEGKRYGHIIDPLTGYPVEDILGTTIIASDATRADALSTSAFILGESKAVDMIKGQQETYGLVILPAENDGLIIRISDKIAGEFKLLNESDDVVIERF